MRSLSGKLGVAIGAAFLLAGCLVSEDPVLDAKSGEATPLAAGDYAMCPLSDEADDADCESVSISVDNAGLYTFTNANEPDEPAYLRMRRIARRGYAVQINEDDGYMYYYGRGDKKRFTLTMMMCASLSKKMRDRLLERGDLEADGDDKETCVVNTVRGLTAAARDYHFGRASGPNEDVVLEMKPATDE